MRMTPSALSFLLICTLMATASSQQQSTNAIIPGVKFTFTCDASRAGSPPPGVVGIQQLTIYRNLTSTNSFSTVAQYRSNTPSSVSPNVTTIPPGRNWTFTFTGENGGVNNQASMRIVWDINDAVCTDAGIYRCQIDYYVPTGPIVTVYAPDVNVTATTGLSNFALAVDPNNNDYAMDDNVTFTCSAVGPATGVTFKWELWVKDQNDMDLYRDLPANSEIVPKPPTLQTGNSGCVQYNWASMLRIQVPGDYDQQAYKCIVTYLQQQESGNWTIGLKPETEKAAAASTGPDVGMIVGIIIGCLVAIAIVVGIILFLRYRNRSQESGSGNKDEIDTANDANLHAPPPVFYPSSKQSKGSKDEKDAKIPTGTTNEALDTSYDSRDSVSKGPPRYANAESDAQGPPRYEKEVKRGRQNRGYDEEERERNEKNDRNTSQGRRQPREREERRHRSRDHDNEEPPRRRYYNADDGTDSRIEMGDPNMGTSI